MRKCGYVDWVASVLVIIGGISWGLVGLFDFNLFAFIFGDATMIARVVYVVVGVAAVWMIFCLVRCGKHCRTAES